jgi:hypothetical protein
VNLPDAVDREDVAGGLARELVRTVRGADRDRERVDISLLHEVGGLFRIGQQHVAGELAGSARTVFFRGVTGLERTQAARFAFNRDECSAAWSRI